MALNAGYRSLRAQRTFSCLQFMQNGWILSNSFWRKPTYIRVALHFLHSSKLLLISFICCKGESQFNTVSSDNITKHSAIKILAQNPPTASSCALTIRDRYARAYDLTWQESKFPVTTRSFCLGTHRLEERLLSDSSQLQRPSAVGTIFLSVLADSRKEFGKFLPCGGAQRNPRRAELLRF